MVRKFLKSATGISVGLLAVLTFLVMFFTEPPYSQEEMDWSAANRPGLKMEVCAEEFGY